MIPVKLALRNFMCYRDSGEVLDLSGVHLACLSGENGAGKSTLLEAITWALWGKARGRSLNNEVLSTGASEGEIDYHFILGDQHYRVIRKRALKGKTTTTVLELQVTSDPDADTWRTLSGATIQETQARINDLLKLDYETFINSAFILQGRADEFTIKSPTDRKKVLAEILGLDQYDRLEEAAKEEAKERKAKIVEIDGFLVQIDKELLQRPTHVRELDETENTLLQAQSSLSTLRGELGEIATRYQAIEHSKRRLDEMQSRLRRREADAAATQMRLGKLAARKDEIEALLARREEIVDGYGRWQAADKEERKFSDNLKLLREFEREHDKHERQLDMARIELDGKRSRHEDTIALLQRNLAGRGVIESQLSEALDKLRGLETLARQHEDTKCLRENLDVKMRTLTAARDTLEREGRTLRQKLDMVTEAHGAGHANCPLCDTPLGEEALGRVQRSFKDDIEAKRREFGQKSKELDTANVEIIQIERRLEKEREGLKPLDMHRRRQASLEQKISTLDQDEQTLVKEEGQLLAVKTRLADGDYAHEARESMALVASEIKRLEYDREAHHRVSLLARELGEKGFKDDYQRLEVDGRELEGVLARITEYSQSLEEWGIEQERERKEIDALLPEASGAESVKASLDTKRKEEEELARQVHTLAEQRGGLRNRIARCDTLQEEKARLMAEYNIATEEKGIYDELTVAFGKKGIQAMIIENVIPEVEDEANALLSRMSDGRMSLRFDTQRDAKSSKNVIETLEINISDEVGTRKYEMYSGGEAFRVNFAVRIALSKLLARRAGTRLQTLVIDEGFGSQDGQGREKLVGAIRSIQDDFEKILVITHIEELKDEFPTRINIIKTPNGSRIVRAEEG